MILNPYRFGPVVGSGSSVITYDFESGTIPAAFTNANSWYVVSDADAGASPALTKALASNDIPSSGTTSLFLNNVDGAEVIIRAKVQSEAGYDFLRVYKNGVEQFNSSGVQTSYSEYRFFVGDTGTDDIEFRYSKDSGVDGGTDDARISKVVVMPEVPTPPAEPSGGWRYFMLETRTTGGFLGAFSANTITLTTAADVDEALQSNGGVATAVGWTPSGGQPITNVNDGNDTTYAQGTAAAGYGKGVMIDLGAPTPGISYMGVKAAVGAESVLTGRILAKVNSGDEWTVLKYLNESAWAAGEFRNWLIGAPETGTVTTYSYSGTTDEITIPSGVSTLRFKMWGAGGSGGIYNTGTLGGGGGYTSGTLAVTPGDVIRIQVPQGGRAPPSSASAGAGGWPDGGSGNLGDVYPGGGGGSARIWKNGTLAAVAGGGGGGSGFAGNTGGAGGGTSGQSRSGNGGTGGSQIAGGNDPDAPARVSSIGLQLTTETNRTGAWGGDQTNTTTGTAQDGGGGGGGYWGGGGGGGDGQSGGGGSGYLSGSVTGGETLAGSTQVPGGSSKSGYPGGTIGVGSASTAPGAGYNINHGGNGYVRIVLS